MRETPSFTYGTPIGLSDASASRTSYCISLFKKALSPDADLSKAVLSLASSRKEKIILPNMNAKKIIMNFIQGKHLLPKRLQKCFLRCFF